MISAILLAGGKSRRMGRDKALLPFRGTTLGLFVACQLKTSVDEVVVIAHHPEWFPGFRVVGDRFPDRGPLEGLATGLEAIMGDRALLVACDMPSLDIGTVSEILSQPHDHLAILPVTSEGIEPFGGLYHRDLLPLIRAALDRGERSLRRFISTIPYDTVPLAQSEAFVNLNHPAEYEDAIGHSRPFA